METTCPHCGQSMDNWTWIRFAGVGCWKDKNTYYGCHSCHLRFDGTVVPEVKEPVLKNRFISTDRRQKAHYKDVQTRVIGDDGQTVLKGKEGLSYMEKHSDNPGYVKRLKDYYNA